MFEVLSTALAAAGLLYRASDKNAGRSLHDVSAFLLIDDIAFLS
jgi:hypothetical protein